MLEVLCREVCRVDLGGQPRLEGRPEPPQIVKVDAGEEWVLLDLLGAGAAEAGLGVADEAGWRSVRWGRTRRWVIVKGRGGRKRKGGEGLGESKATYLLMRCSA